MGYQNQIQKSIAQVPGVYRPVGAHTQDNTFSSAKAIAIPDGANGLLVQCATQNVRYTIDGTTPTATVGFLLNKDTSPVLLYKIDDDCIFTFIETAATAVIIYQAVRITGE